MEVKKWLVKKHKLTDTRNLKEITWWRTFVPVTINSFIY